MHRRRFADPTTLLRALAIAIVLAGGIGVGSAGATPPQSPIDLRAYLLEEPAAGRPLRFAVELEPLVPGERLRLRVRLPRGVELSGLDTLNRLAAPTPGVRHRLTGILRGAPGARHHVAFLAELDAPGGVTFTRGETFSWLAGESLVPEPVAQLIADPPTALRATDPRLAATWTASGRFLYRDRLQDRSGFTGAEPDRAARLVDVQVVDATSGTILATGATDGAGYYAIPVSDTQIRTVQARMVSLSSATPGLLLDVRNNSTQRLAYTVGGPTSAGHDPSADVDFGTTTALPGAGGEAFNVFDVLLDGLDYCAVLQGGPRPLIRLTAYWQANSVDGSYFVAGTNAIHLRGGEGYDDTVIGHEQGHYVARNWSNDDSPGGTHYIGDNFQDLRLAWSEGWATFFACATRRAFGREPLASAYIDTQGAPGPGNLNFSFELEGPDMPALGAGSELAVGAVLWDVIDDASTPDPFPGVDDDALARPVAEPWDVMTNALPLPGVNNVALEDFWDGWFKPGSSKGFAAEMAAIFAAQRVRYVADAHEPDDTIAQASPLATTGAPQERTFYAFGDVDHVRFDTMPGWSYVVETTDLLSDANTHLTVLAPDQVTIVGTSDDRNATDASSRVEFAATGPGPYYARLVHAADLGVYGTYAVRVLRSPSVTPAFTEVGVAAGVANAGNSRGCAWGDADGDGDPDLFVTNVGGTTALYRNDGTTFANRATAWGLALAGDTEGAAWCDYDKDGDLDLFVSAIGASRLMQNRRADNGDSVFVDVTAASGLSRTAEGRSCAWTDANRDGLADLYLTDLAGQAALFSGDGDGTFTDVTAATGAGFAGTSMSVAWCDYDRDGDDDFYVTGYDQPSRLFRNLLRDTGTLGFADATAEAGVPAGISGFAAEWADFDGDGQQDLYVTSAGGSNILYRNRGDGTFEDVTLLRNVGSAYYSTVGAFADVENDGDLDLFVGSLAQSGLAGENRLALNVGGQFTAAAAMATAATTRAAAWADYDRDGDLDLYVSLGGAQANQLWRNEATNPNRLEIALLGRASNRDGFGATVRVRTGPRVQHRVVSGGTGFGSQHSIPVECGLGGGTSADSVVVDWPSGRRSILTAVPAGVLIVDEQTAVDAGPPPLAGAAPWTLALATPAPQPAPGGRTRLAFTVPAGAPMTPIRLVLFDVAGRRVRTLAEGAYAPGPHALGFDGCDGDGARLAPGVYLLALEGAAVRITGKLVVLPGSR
jgi:hypothetical protein